MHSRMKTKKAVKRRTVTRTASPKSPSKHFFEALKSLKSADWMRDSKELQLSLFKRMSASVPAYKDFLRSLRIGMQDVRSVETIPIMSKKNYLREHAFSELLWDGSLRAPYVLTATSGSTGKPVYFARSHKVDEQSSLIHELIFDAGSLQKDKPTLVIDCFGMGVWIGGLITYQAYKLMSLRGYPISILTPGINKKEILKILSDIAPQYDQIIMTGYAPFLKDVIDEALSQGISFEKYRMNLLFAAEAFSERFREHIAQKVGLKNILTDAINIYGSADIGTMAFETPISILARRLAMKHEALFTDIFGSITKTPTLAQYIPKFVSFETVDGEILLSGDSAIPLLKYSIGDRGGVYSFAELVERFKKYGVDLRKEARAAGIQKHMLELPFVYVFERIDLATTLYGLQVYPETIKEVLIESEFADLLTGKLTLITKFDANHDQYLEVNIECKPHKEVGTVFAAKLLEEIVKRLCEKNSEFRELYNFLGERARPKLLFWPYEDPLYFKSGGKHPWVVRQS